MSWSADAVRVRVPATSANLGPGFDALGLALTLHDEVEARICPAGLSIEITGEGADLAGAGEEHLVLRAMRAAFAVTGGQPPGLGAALPEPDPARPRPRLLGGGDLAGVCSPPGPCPGPARARCLTRRGARAGQRDRRASRTTWRPAWAAG